MGSDHSRISLFQVVNSLKEAEELAEDSVDEGLKATHADNVQGHSGGPTLNPDGSPKTQAQLDAQAQANDASVKAADASAQALALSAKFGLQQKLDTAIETAVTNSIKETKDQFSIAANAV